MLRNSASSPPPTEPWWATRRFRSIAVGVLVVVVCVEGYVAIFKRENDFVCHRNWGLAFLAGDPYRDLGAQYPVGRTMLDAIPATLGHRTSRWACYALAIAALVACYGIWRRLASRNVARHDPGVGPRDAAAALFAAALLFPYILRDLDECGLQIFLLFMLSAGAYAACAARSATSGLWLGLAVNYKMLPVICLPFLVWKRQWRAAAWTAAFVAIWALMPALYLGWQKTIECHGEWFGRMADSLTVHGDDPSLNGFEEPKQQNQALPAAINRYLSSYPPGHPLYLDHPLFVQFGDFTPATTGWISKAALALLGASLAWRFRKCAGRQDVWDQPREWAAICIMCALFSPLCWKQHLILALPAAFLIFQTMLSNGRLPRWQTLLLVVTGAAILLTKRFVLGKDLSILVMSYKFDTAAMLALMLIVLTLPRRSADSSAAARTEGEPLHRRLRVAA